MAENCSQGACATSETNYKVVTVLWVSLEPPGNKIRMGCSLWMVLTLLKPFKSAWYFPPQNQKFSKVDEIRDEEKNRKLVQLDNLFYFYIYL